MSFLAWSALWFALAIIPLVALYFLKLKRPRRTVPSLVLWSQVIADQRVNSPFQAFRKHILLWLQLIILLLLVLAAMQPVLIGAGGDARERLPVVVDVSASMAASDGPGGSSRLDIAKERLRERIANLLPGQQLAIIAASDRAWRLTGFTDNKRLLRAAVDQLQVEEVAGDAGPALRLAQGLAQTAAVERVWFLSDGNLPPSVDVELGLDLDYDLIPPGGANAGITACQARLGNDGRWELLVGIGASDVEPMTGTVTVSQEDWTLIEQPVQVAAGESRRLLLRLPGEASGQMALALAVSGHDSLASDNRAWLTLPRPRPLRVAVDSGLSSWAAAIRVLDGFVAVEPGADPDLLVTRSLTRFGQEAPLRVLVGAAPDDLGALYDIGDGGSTVTDWSPIAPALRHVGLADLTIIDRLTWKDGRGPADAELAGYRVLVHGDQGPLLLGGGERRDRRYVFAFDTERSTLPYRVGFPVLVANFAGLVRSDLGLAEASGRRTGVMQVEDVSSPGDWTITGPDGSSQSREVGSSRRIDGIAAPAVGLYEVSQGDESFSLGAALLDRRETALSVTERLEFGEGAVAAGDVRQEDRNLWPLLALLALCVCMAEWWWFQRRPGGW